MAAAYDSTKTQNTRVMRRMPRQASRRNATRCETRSNVGWRAVCHESGKHGSGGGQGFLRVRLSYPTVIRYEPPPCPDLGGEEVGRDQHVQMRADTLLPRGRRLPLWRWGDAVALENVPHRLVTDRIAQVRQRSSNAIVAPGTIFLGHADNQGL